MPTRRKPSKNKATRSDSFFDSFLNKEIALAPSPFEVYKESKKPKLLQQNDASIVNENSNGSGKSKTTSGTKKTGLFGNVWQVLNSDVVWLSIAVASLLGVVLFYFQGLQPLLLNNYVDQSQAQVSSVKQSFTSQVSGFSQTQNKLIQSFAYNTSEVCNAKQTYSSKDADVSEVERLKVELLPKLEYQTLPNYKQFYDKEVRSSYSQLYSEYTDSLKKVQSQVDEVSLWPSYLDYRNNWIQACTKIQSSNGEVSELKNMCSDLQSKTDAYKQTKLPAFWSDVQKNIDTTLAKCVDIQNQKGTTFAQIGTWKLDWLSSYERFMQYQPDIQATIQTINTTATKLRDESDRVNFAMSEIRDGRQGIGNIWYFLNFEMK